MREIAGVSVYPVEGPSSVVAETEGVSPPRESKSTDASKLSLPIGWVAGIVVAVGGFGISQALSMAALRSDVRDILTRMQYEVQISERDAKIIESRFAALEAKIEAAGLRNAAMSLSQELQKKGR